MTDFDLEFGLEDELVTQSYLPDPPRLTASNFQYDLYDWEDPEFLEKNRGPFSFRAILLTQGYFMIVSKLEYRRMTQYPDGSPMVWYAKIDRDPDSGAIKNVYARRRGREGEPRDVYAHRMVMGCLHVRGKVVDHKNGVGLDNRATKGIAINLEVTHGRRNANNAVRHSADETKLAGVERVGPEKKFYGGKICKRFKTGKVQTIRSKRHWSTPGPAHKWYLNQLKRRNGNRTEWACSPSTVNFPDLPPRWDVEPEQKDVKNTTFRKRVVIKGGSRLHDDVPF